MVDWLKKAPTPLLVVLAIAVTIATLSYLGGYVFLTANGVDTTDYRSLLNTALNYVGLLFGAAATAASVSAARSASKAEDQTNGHLTERDAEIERLRGLLAERGISDGVAR